MCDGIIHFFEFSSSMVIDTPENRPYGAVRLLAATHKLFTSPFSVLFLLFKYVFYVDSNQEETLM